MANMTVGAINGLMTNGNLEQVLDRGRSLSIEGGFAQGPLQGTNDAASSASSFGEMLKQSLEKTNEVQEQADRAVKELIAGRNKNIHETMLMVEKADMNFRLMMQVRNKVIDAYREVMRMQV